VFQNPEKDLNLNLVAVRTANPVVDEFRCQLFVFWPLAQGGWAVKTYRITTLPGRYWLQERLLNEKGCAILVPGQYLSSWRIGWHHNRYEALVQARPVRIYRDGNRDAVFDYMPLSIEVGMFGLNIHRAGASGTVPLVGKYSAGCQVFEDAEDFAEFMSLCKRARENWEEFFTYTLLEESDLP
jgi:hypothetical protein